MPFGTGTSPFVLIKLKFAISRASPPPVLRVLIFNVSSKPFTTRREREFGRPKNAGFMLKMSINCYALSRLGMLVPARYNPWHSTSIFLGAKSLICPSQCRNTTKIVFSAAGLLCTDQEETMSEQAAEHHIKAAEHHEQAALHHREAARHHQEGDHQAAAHHAHTAQGHVHHAAHHGAEAAKLHLQHHGHKAKAAGK
jgi:hypothetical protein